MRRSVLPAGLLAVVLALGIGGAAPVRATTGPYPNPQPVVGDVFTHDPSLLIRSSAPRYVSYSTHNKSLESDDRVAWRYTGPVPYTGELDWFAPGSPGAWTAEYTQLWAPDVSFHDGKYWLYYAAWKARQTTAIGLATSTTGLPGTFTETGDGPLISSKPGDPYNAIDPNLFVDDDGKWWLTFGSYWNGIFMTELDPTTGRMKSSPPVLTNVASRVNAIPFGNIEAAHVWRHGGHHYLFVSFDKCCVGADSTYSVRVGRSTTGPLGPYYDRDGVAMLNGGGTKILGSHGAIRGPGGQSVVHDPYTGQDLLVYHYYHRDLGGQPFLGINELVWENGWPRVVTTPAP